MISKTDSHFVSEEQRSTYNVTDIAMAPTASLFKIEPGLGRGKLKVAIRILTLTYYACVAPSENSFMDNFIVLLVRSRYFSHFFPL